MAVLGRGLFYEPSPPPQSGDFRALGVWCLREFERIAMNMREGRSEYLRLDTLEYAPAKPIEGMMCIFKANVVGPQDGVYQYKNGAWVRL